MPLQATISVELKERSYEIAIGSGLIGELNLIPQLENLNHVVVVSDSRVAGHYLNQVTSQLEGSRTRVNTIVVPEGEASKSINKLDEIWNQLLEYGTDRKSTIVALGGGVVGDLAGFAASTFARGINFVQLPTSLLAQVDSSVGGKTGINLPGSKNMVGAFWQPKFVLIDTAVVETLDHLNYRAGLAEVIKYGVIMDADFFHFLKKHHAEISNRDSIILGSVIAKCCQLKARIVQEDETEVSGRRAILNYGHTFGHAIENVFGYGQYLHGQAIAIGMHCAAELAHRLGRVDQTFVDEQKNLIECFELPSRISDSSRCQELVAAMHRDKKVANGILRLILPTRIGHVDHCDAPHDDVLMEVF